NEPTRIKTPYSFVPRQRPEERAQIQVQPPVHSGLVERPRFSNTRITPRPFPDADRPARRIHHLPSPRRRGKKHLTRRDRHRCAVRTDRQARGDPAPRRWVRDKKSRVVHWQYKRRGEVR
uniref:Uncharacterized protein n=1 Tax=Oryza punctata TaxID=4537 RepID=A0A0E0JVU9_ORYPU